MKRYFLSIFLLIFIVGFLISPSIGIAGDEKIQLSINEKEFILNLVQKKLKQQAMLMWADPDIIPEKQASFVVIQRAIEKEMFSFFFVEAPKKVTIDVVKTIFKIVQVFYGGEVSANILSEIEKMSVEKAINYLTQYLLKYEIKIANGNLDYSYISYKGTSQKASFQYIITYQNLGDNKAKAVVEFYSAKTIEPPRFTNTAPSDLREDLKPFILRVKGNLGEESGGYYWLDEPEIEVVFNEPVPDLGFKEPGFFDKLKNRLNEIETAFERAVEMLTNIFGKFNLFQAALNPVVPENIVSEIPEIDISEINLESLLPIKEKIAEMEEKLSTGTQETEEAGDRTSEINLEEVQRALEEIGKEVEIITQNIQEIAQEQGIDLEQGFSGQEQGGVGQQMVFSTGASRSETQEQEPEPEPEPEPELDVGAGSPSPEEEGEETSPLQPEPEIEPEPEPEEQSEPESGSEEEEEGGGGEEGEPLKDTIPPEVIFELESVQTSLSFTLSWTATDPMDPAYSGVTPSGIDGFYLQYHIPGLETTSPSDEGVIVLWYQEDDQGDDEEWQDWSMSEILELGSDKENLLVLGKDGYTYNFQLQVRDKAGNLSQWQEAPTTIIIPKEEPPVFSEAVWPMYQHDAQHTGRSSFTGPAISSEPELSILIEGEGLGPAVIGSDRTIYLKTGQGLTAFNYDGSQKWTYELSSLYGTPGLWEPDKAIYVFSQDEGISAIDIRDGSLKWKKGFNILLNQNPIIGDNGKIYFITEDSGLIVLNKNGEQEWNYDFGPASNPVSNLAVDPVRNKISNGVDQEDTIYFGHGDTLFAINSQGEKWQRTFESKCKYYNCNPEVREISIADDGTIYVLVAWESDFVSMTDADRLNCIHALNPEDPSEEQEKWSTCWRFSLIPVPISFQGNIYLSISWLDFTATLRTRIMGYDAQGNSIVNWQPPVWGGIGRVNSMILDEEENLYALLSFYDNTVKALSPNGEEKWSLILEKGTGPIFPLILGKDNDLFISTANKLFVIK